MANPENDTDQSLDAFEAEFYGKAPKVETPTEEVAEETATEEEESETPTEDDPLATEEETDETEAEESEASVEEDEEEAPKPKGKKTFQERIDELTAKAREAERERDALKARLEESKQPEQTEAPKPSKPDPDAKKEDGTPLYPLGDLDPQFIEDRITFAMEAREAEYESKRQKQLADEAQAAEQARLSAEWEMKLARAEEALPDLREKGAVLEEAFEGLDPEHGQYVAATIMRMEKGPEVLYYLADNAAEARTLVSGDPIAVAMKLGAIQERLSTPAKPAKTVRESKAPPPAPLNKGNKTVRPIKPDTDDLDAFEKAYFRS